MEFYVYVIFLTVFTLTIMGFAWLRSLKSIKETAKEAGKAEAIAEAKAEATIRVAREDKDDLVATWPQDDSWVNGLTDKEIAAKIEETFTIMDLVSNKAINGKIKSLIISGPAGLGKSYTVEQNLAAWAAKEEKHVVVKGYVRATGLFKKLYQCRHEGHVLVFDDSDSIFRDETMLNMLKAVLDSSNSRRRVSYLTERKMKTDDGEDIPSSFDFEGTVIFISNLDFDGMIERGHRLEDHFKAMLSRSHYIDMDMRTKREHIIRIKQVIGYGMLDSYNLTKKELADVVQFIEDNVDKLRELSLRVAEKLAVVRQGSDKTWMAEAKMTLLKKR